MIKLVAVIWFYLTTVDKSDGKSDHNIFDFTSKSCAILCINDINFVNLSSVEMAIKTG